MRLSMVSLRVSTLRISFRRSLVSFRFLYQGREVSYSSVLDRSISTRREALYKSRGLDIEHWMDLVAEAKGLRKEIARIAEDYDEDVTPKEDSKNDDDRELDDEDERVKKISKVDSVSDRRSD